MYSNLEDTKQTSHKWGSLWKIGIAVIGLVLIEHVVSLHQDKSGGGTGAVIVKRQDKMMTAEKQLLPNPFRVSANEDSNPSAAVSALGGYTNMKNLIETRGCPNLVYVGSNKTSPMIFPSQGCEITPTEVTLFAGLLGYDERNLPYPVYWMYLTDAWSRGRRVTVTTEGSVECSWWDEETVGPPLSEENRFGCSMSTYSMAVNQNLPMIARPLDFVQIDSLIRLGNMCPQQLIMKSVDGKRYVMPNSGGCYIDDYDDYPPLTYISFWTKFDTGEYGTVFLQADGASLYRCALQMFGADGKRGKHVVEDIGIRLIRSFNVSDTFPVPSPFVVRVSSQGFEVVY